MPKIDLIASTGRIVVQCLAGEGDKRRPAVVEAELRLDELPKKLRQIVEQRLQHEAEGLNA